MIDEVIITREWVLNRSDFESFSDEELKDICDGNDAALTADFEQYAYDVARDSTPEMDHITYG